MADQSENGIQRRQDLARQWNRASTELLTLIEREFSPQTLLQRAKYRLASRQTQALKRTLAREVNTATRHMEFVHAGASPSEWGVLSGGRVRHDEISLEETLRAIKRSNPQDPDIHEKTTALLSVLPRTRSMAELGEGTARTARIEAQVLTMAQDPKLESHQRRALLEHLPGHLRPLPKSLDALDRRQIHIRLSVTFQGPNEETFENFAPTGQITLNDIVVSNEMRGLGLGTATLTELCRYADHHGYSIEGKLQPGPKAPDSDIPPLARWYARMGFTQGNTEPSQWKRMRTMSRVPRPAEGPR